MRGRLLFALEKLSREPPEGDIKKLQGRNGYRARVADYRIIYDIIDSEVNVFDIAPRGQVYKDK